MGSNFQNNSGIYEEVHVINRRHVMTFTVVLVLAALAPAQTFTDLYNFTGSSGAWSYTGLVEDNIGNLYGTTLYGGSSNYGVVFEVSSSGTATVLYNFTGSTDGGYPFAPVIRDSQGNLYGTTETGGTASCGVVFKVDTAGNETVLYSFAGGPTDGCYPYQGLVMDKKGNLYGTTSAGGVYGWGAVYKLTPQGKETMLHSFGAASDGEYPYYGHLLIDGAGNLYGITLFGGSSYEGVLYKLTPKGKETVLHSFAGGSSDGCWPYGSVTIDKAGNLYGTTEFCGSSDHGTVWKVSPDGTETILHNFAGGKSDGCEPIAGVVLDSKGNLYGNTQLCGAWNYGTVWRLSTKGKLKLLHSFAYSDGAFPIGELLRTATGELFGTTNAGGSSYYGTVWSYVP
jgi:uncharacterized repeat protein (TIGR03803 family)